MLAKEVNRSNSKRQAVPGVKLIASHKCRLAGTSKFFQDPQISVISHSEPVFVKDMLHAKNWKARGGSGDMLYTYTRCTCRPSWSTCSALLDHAGRALCKPTQLSVWHAVLHCCFSALCSELSYSRWSATLYFERSGMAPEVSSGDFDYLIFSGILWTPIDFIIADSIVPISDHLFYKLPYCLNTNF